MSHFKIDNIVYAICEGDVQYEAQYVLGRELTEEEMLTAVDALSYGIGESIGIIYHTIFTELVPKLMKGNDQ